MSLALLNLYNTSVLTEFLIIKTRVFQDTVCKQHVYQNMAAKKKLKNSCGVSTLQKQKLLINLVPNLVPRACDPREGIEGSGIIRFREESDWPLKWNA